MKKLLLLTPLLMLLAAPARAEAIKLKSGVIINGSIIGRTEYVLSVQTSYGTIAINQREIEAILPDLHRVLLKGGGEFVGTVLDLDEFNLSLKTDSGVVNLDVAQIASMEIYDYGEAQRQQKYVERKIELEQEALAALAPTATASQAAEAAAAGSLSTSGLSFDSDLEKAFPTKPVEVQPQQRYSYRMNDNTYMGRQVEPEEETPPAPAAPEDEYTEEQAKIKDYARNYFAVNAGGLSASLKINLLKDIEAGELIKEVGGAGVTFGAQYQRRLTDRLWLGGVLNIGLIPQNITEASPQLQIKTTGQIIDFDILFGFYLNPKSKTRLYLLGGGGLSSVNIDKNAVRLTDPGGPNEGWVPLESQSAKSSGFGALFGAGIERSVMDINLALELRGQYNSLSRDFEGSRKINYYALLKAGWFF